MFLQQGLVRDPVQPGLFYKEGQPLLYTRFSVFMYILCLSRSRFVQVKVCPTKIVDHNNYYFFVYQLMISFFYGANFFSLYEFSSVYTLYDFFFLYIYIYLYLYWFLLFQKYFLLWICFWYLAFSFYKFFNFTYFLVNNGISEDQKNTLKGLNLQNKVKTCFF